MANLTLTANWELNIYRYDQGDPVQGWDGTDDGVANLPIKQLGNRTEYLYNRAKSSNGLPGMRNVVISGEKAVNGQPDVIAIVSGQIRVKAATVPLLVSISGGFDNEKPVEYYLKITANADVAPVTPTGFNLVYLDFDPNTGSPSVIVENLPAVSQVSYTAPSSPVAGDYWYDLNTDTNYQYNGTTWVKIYRVYLGFALIASNTVFTFPFRYDNQQRFGRGAVYPGTVVMSAFQGQPDGYLVCNGAAVSRVVYSELFRAIGTVYGVGDGSTTFNLPDFRGVFPRGFDASRGLDPGRVFGTYQADKVGPHTHPLTDVVADSGSFGGFYFGGYNTGIQDTLSPSGHNVLANSGTETAPKNLAVNFCIKY